MKKKSFRKNGPETIQTKENEKNSFNAYNWMRLLTLRFSDSELEQAFHAQMDRWFIPALAIAILFLIIYGIYQVKIKKKISNKFFSPWLCHVYLSRYY